MSETRACVIAALTVLDYAMLCYATDIVNLSQRLHKHRLILQRLLSNVIR